MRAGVVAPLLAGLVQQRQGGEAGDPLVGAEGRRRPRRAERHQPQLGLGHLDRVRAGRRHDDPEPQAEGQQVLDRDGPRRRDRVVERALQAAQDAPLGQLRQQLVDGIGDATARRRRPGAWRRPRRSAWSARRCGRWRRGASAPGRPAPRARAPRHARRRPGRPTPPVPAPGRSRRGRRDGRAAAAVRRVETCAHAGGRGRSVMRRDASGSVPPWRRSQTSSR